MASRENRLKRRDFLRKSVVGAALAAEAGAFAVPALAKSQSPSEKLNIAGIGAGGRGYDDLVSVSSENIVALCDVDDKRAGKTSTKVARRYALATQLGNGAHSGYNYRSMVALIKAGTIGEVRRPAGPQVSLQSDVISVTSSCTWSSWWPRALTRA